MSNEAPWLQLWLVCYNPSGRRKQAQITLLDINPLPTIMAGGVANENRSHYWLEFAESKAELIEKLKGMGVCVES